MHHNVLPAKPVPNIVYIHSHDTGRYIQPYGHAVPTPHLQAFAEQGVLFRQAFAAAPTCSPSRAALLTGRYPHQCGMIALAHKGGRLTDPSQHLASYLKQRGYRTALSGTQHVTERQLEALRAIGYERHLTSEDWPSWAKDFEAWNEWFAEAAARYILQADPEQPFFLDCGFDLTHRMGEGEQWHTTRGAPAGDSRYVRPPAPLPDTPETRRDFADFCVAARLLDQCIGRVLDALDTAGLTGDTLVIITTDHGLAYPQMKCTLTAHGTGVLLLMRGPKGFTGGRVIDALVSHIDLFPTICDVAGLPAPSWLEGTSLMPLLAGASSVRDEVHAEVNWHAAPEPMRTIRTARFSYIRRYGTVDHVVLPNCDDSVSKTLLHEHGWAQRGYKEEELYDLIFDPNEAHNCADDPRYAATLDDMRGRLAAWMRRTDDPLLTGRLEPGPGAVSKKPGDLSPQGEWAPAETIVIGDAVVRAAEPADQHADRDA